MTESSARLPAHVAISLGSLFAHSQEPDLGSLLLGVKNTAKACFRMGIPMVTFQMHAGPVTPADVRFWTHACDDLARWDFLHSDKVKVSVLGKWYGLSDALVEKVKQVLQASKDYDGFFLNLCLNYDGQEEIVDACRLVAMQVRQGRLDADSITAASLKESVATSSLLPPDVMIIVGEPPSLRGFLLWDSSHARVVFVRKQWADFTKDDLLGALAL